ncbi:MAG: hypothetical protein ACFE0I_16620 [Elainellaceae cyanobacterium]
MLLGYVNQRPIHVVVAIALEIQTVYVITAYEPDSTLWQTDFRTRKNP